MAGIGLTDALDFRCLRNGCGRTRDLSRPPSGDGTTFQRIFGFARRSAGGVAFIGADDAFEDSDSETGWVAGLGVEHKIKPNLSIGLEGLYYDFGNGEDFRVADGYGNYGDAHVDDLTFWTVRARLTYHFGERYEEPLK